jgi:SRSO17 transposase
LLVKTNEDRVATVGHSVAVEEWLAEFDTGFAAVAGRFRRVEPRRQARAFLLGLLSDVDTRSCWQLAEQVGNTSPHAMQRLLGEAVWDADAVRDDVRGYVVDALADPDGVLILDDTGDLKKGNSTIATQRQYTGTAGRIENGQVTVFLAYATPRGSTLIDREVYLPKAWTDDPARCAAAGVPDDVRFATKITLGRRMLARALDARVPTAWATADEFYGRDRQLRRDLQTRGVGYVLAVAKSHRVTCTVDGLVRADRLAAALPARAWNRTSAGTGSKGERDYDWAWITIIAPDGEAGGRHSLLVRRRIGDGELAFYRCWSPRPVALRVLVRVAGTRWSVEACFQTGKRIGLDEHQVRRWRSWYRHTTLVMLAHAILTVITARERDEYAATADQTLIPLTFNEIRRLFARLITNTIHTINHWLHWSTWRRRHQARAKTSHHRQRGQLIHQQAST